MPCKTDNYIIDNRTLDRRVKLTKEQKSEIKKLYMSGEYSQRRLAKIFNVSRRTIQFTLNPEALKQNLMRREERGGWRQYYNKSSHREYISNHRKYKKVLLSNGLLKKRRTHHEEDS